MEKTRIPAPPRTQRPTSSTEQPVTTSMPVKSSNSPATGGARGTRFKCFNCGMEGHMARSCPYPKRNRRDDEARRPQQSDPPRNTMSTLVTEESDGQREMEELWRRLREAWTKAIARSKTRAMTEVTTSCKKQDQGLGAVYTEIAVNGVPTKTLVDTGSPATIISLDHIMGILAAEQGLQQTTSQWEEETVHKFSRPKVSLSAYGGHRLDILCQICVRLSQGDQTGEGPVLVQQGAPNDLLLGTDFQSQLGFVLVLETPAKFVDLLTGEECISQDGSPVTCGDSLAEKPPVPRDKTRVGPRKRKTTPTDRRKDTSDSQRLTRPHQDILDAPESREEAPPETLRPGSAGGDQSRIQAQLKFRPGAGGETARRPVASKTHGQSYLRGRKMATSRCVLCWSPARRVGNLCQPKQQTQPEELTHWVWKSHHERVPQVLRQRLKWMSEISCHQHLLAPQTEGSCCLALTAVVVQL